MTVTEVPTAPEVGLRTIAGVVTVKVAKAVSPVTVATSLPDAVTVWPPADSEGTTKVHEKAPAAEVVWAVHVWVEIVPPAIVIDPTVVLAEKPDPVTVTVTPTGPWVGDSEIVGVVTLKAVESTTAAPEYTMTKSEPSAVPEGTVTVVAPGIAPATVAVKVVPDPATQLTVPEVVLRQML